MSERTEMLRMELTQVSFAISLVKEAASAKPPDAWAMDFAIKSAVDAMQRAQKIIQEINCDIQAKIDEL